MGDNESGIGDVFLDGYSGGRDVMMKETMTKETRKRRGTTTAVKGTILWRTML